MHSNCWLVPTAPVFLCIVFSSPDAAAADDEVVTKLTAARIERIIKSLDVRNFKELDHNLYGFEIAGFKILLHNGGDTMQVMAMFQGRATLTRLNEWNRTKKFTKAYLDMNDNICIDHAIHLTGGVTEKHIKDSIGLFVFCLTEFKKHMEE